MPIWNFLKRVYAFFIPIRFSFLALAVLVFSFSVLGWVGTRIYQEAPPLPDRVVASDGTVVIPGGDIGRGQNVWQAMGGMEMGSIWGHGSYVAPDWTADYLHNESTMMLDQFGNPIVLDTTGMTTAPLPPTETAAVIPVPPPPPPPLARTETREPERPPTQPQPSTNTSAPPQSTNTSPPPTTTSNPPPVDPKTSGNSASQ